MFVLGILDGDFVNYKKVCMTVETPYCDFKCGKENCQNYHLFENDAPMIHISNQRIAKIYIENPVAHALSFQGLEPFTSGTFEDILEIIDILRNTYNNHDDIIIWTGYNEDEVAEQLKRLKKYDNIIVKFGRYIPNTKKRMDEVLGVELYEPQYARRLDE